MTIFIHFLGKEYWLGLDNIYALTNRQDVVMQLRVFLENFTDENATAYYDNFSLTDQVHPQNQFRESIAFNNHSLFLNFQTLYKLNLGEYSGSGGDSLSFHSGASFTTIDKDQDTWSNNCSGLYLGGWWYRDCQNSNLNGHNYGTGESTPYGKGIVWNTFNGYYDSLKSDVMAIRPLKIQ